MSDLEFTGAIIIIILSIIVVIAGLIFLIVKPNLKKYTYSKIRSREINDVSKNNDKSDINTANSKNNYSDYYKSQEKTVINNSPTVRHKEYYSSEKLNIAKVLNWYCVVVKIPVCVDDFPVWMNYECGIDNPLLNQQKLLAIGLLKQCNFEETLHKLTVSELKEIIHEQNLPNSKKKAELIDIICNYADRSLIELPIAYTTSEKGNEFLEENKELLIADSYREYGITVEQYFREKERLSTPDNSIDVVKSILNNQIHLFSYQRNYGLVRCVYSHLAKIAEKEENFSEALKNYIFVQYYDVSGLGNNDIFSDKEIAIFPAIMKSISTYREYYNKEMVYECEKLFLPKSLVAFNYFVDLIESIVYDKPIPEGFKPFVFKKE